MRMRSLTPSLALNHVPSTHAGLARTGIRVTLIERDPSSVGKGHNIDVQGSALSVLERMSLLDTLKANNTGERGTTVIDQHGKTLASFPLETGLSPTNPHEILRGDLCGLLHAAAMKQSGVQTIVGRIDPGSVLVNEKGVTASLHDGRPLSGDALVICDGQWSHLRSDLYDPSDITVVDKNFFSFYATIPREEQDGVQWWLCSVDRRRILTARPDPHGSTRAMLLKVPCDAREKESLEAVSTPSHQTSSSQMNSEIDLRPLAHRHPALQSHTKRPSPAPSSLLPAGRQSASATASTSQTTSTCTTSSRYAWRAGSRKIASSV